MMVLTHNIVSSNDPANRAELVCLLFFFLLMRSLVLNLRSQDEKYKAHIVL